MPKLVNLGSLCIDLVYDVPQLAGAGETIASLDRQVFCGGKGLNQSLAAARAGAQVHHFGAVGDDGQDLLQALHDAGVETSGVAQMAGPSGHAVIQVDQQGQNSIVIAGGTNRQLPMELIDRAVSTVADGDWLLLQNETNEVDTTISAAAATSGRVALNLAPPDSRVGDYPIGDLDLLIVNVAEANALAGTSSPGSALRTLIEQYPEVSLLLTMGGDGLYLYDSMDGVAQAMGAFAVTPVDETAAGDSFVGYLMASLVAGENLPDAVLRASAAGALAVTRAGAAPSIPSIEEVGSLIEQQTPSFALREIDPGELA